MKLGKTPARTDSIKFKLSKYIDKSLLPTPPAAFGHETLLGANWSMLGNDKYGDCVWAGAAHETMMWNMMAHHPVTFSDASVLSDYSAVTGFNPNDPSTDQGTDMEKAAAYRRHTGVIDAHGKRHKVGAYLDVKIGDIHEHWIAMYLFGAVGIGIEFPSSAMDQFNEHKPWDVVSHSKIEGGHYVPLVAHRNNSNCVTWGAVQPMTSKFFGKYNDESVCYLSEEMLVAGKSLEGFDLATLRKDLAAL